MQKNLRKMFLVFKKIAFEIVARLYLSCDKNTCDRPSTCQKAVLNIQISLRQMFPDSFCLILMKNKDKSAAV